MRYTLEMRNMMFPDEIIEKKNIAIRDWLNWIRSKN